MYCILNEHSIAPKGLQLADPGPALKTLVDTFNKARSYKLEQVIAPAGFSDLAIAGGISIKAYRVSLQDQDEKRRLTSFLANSVQYFDAHYAEHFMSAEDGRLIEVSYKDTKSSSMRDAHVCDLPLLSFDVDPFRTPFVACEKYILTDVDDKTVHINVANLHHPASFDIHHEVLLKLCQQITLKWKRWSPEDNPCWRKEVTDQIISDAGYPKYTGKESIQEKRSNNTKVVLDILKANGWTFNYEITKLNNGRNEIWKIFSNELSTEKIYISIDLGEGEFEIANRRGKWVNTTFFDGTKNEGKDYSSENTHNINVK